MKAKHKRIKEKTIKRLKSKYHTLCLFGGCKDCIEIKDGKGIHEIEVYEIYKCTQICECDDCKGRGYKTETCFNCDGHGETQETCMECDGNGELYDEFGELEYIKDENVLVKPNVSKKK